MIYYILAKKNDKADILNKKNNHMETKKIFNHSFFKVNLKKFLFITKQQLDIKIEIMTNK